MGIQIIHDLLHVFFLLFLSDSFQPQSQPQRIEKPKMTTARNAVVSGRESNEIVRLTAAQHHFLNIAARSSSFLSHAINCHGKVYQNDAGLM